MADTPTIDAKPSDVAAPSAVTTTDDKLATDASSAQSSEQSLANEIKDIAKKAEAESLPADNEKVETTTEAKDDVKEEHVDEAKVENSDLPPFHEHPRWKEVVAERDTLKSEVAQFRPDAERAKLLDTYCQSNGITEQALRESLEVTALLNTDPRAALEKLKTYVNNLELGLGERLPVDLQKKVDAGTLEVEDAKEIAQARLQKQAVDLRGQQTQQEIASQRAKLITDTVNVWQTNVMKTDPDFNHKFPLLAQVLRGMYVEKPPQTPAEAVALAEAAYKEVNATIKTFIPKPTPKKTLSKTSSSSNAEILIDPKMSQDDALKLIVQKVVANHR